MFFFKLDRLPHLSLFIVIAWKTANRTFSSELLLLCSTEKSKSYWVGTQINTDRVFVFR